MLVDIDQFSVASAVYRELKRRILNLDYRVGERLSEARLAEDLGVARSPVRSALARLKSEGWIEVSPQSGTFIKPMTLKEIREITDLRTLLEARLAGDAATRISEATLAALRTEFEIEGKLIAAGDAEAFIRIDNRLHAEIYDAADNQLIRQILLDLRDKVEWIRRVCAVSLERVQDGFAELEQIRAALERRDERAASQAMCDHVQRAAAFYETLDETAAIVGQMKETGRAMTGPGNGTTHQEENAR
jgi:DNA-binding GntR family transcriptional regulator